MLKMANIVRSKKALENKYFLYEIIDKNSGLTIYDLTKKVGWSAGKINYYIKKLLKDGMIKNTISIVNGRTHKSYFSKSINEFINWNKITNLKKPIKK